MSIKTIRRDTLLKKALVGKLVCVGLYSFDDMRGANRDVAQGLPVRVINLGGEWVAGFCNIMEMEFKTRSGSAYKNDDGIITLQVHSNSNYDLKEI